MSILERRTNTDKDFVYYTKKYLKEKISFDELITKSYALDKVSCALKDSEKRKVIRTFLKLNNGVHL